MGKSEWRKVLQLLLGLGMLYACVKDTNFKSPVINCTTDLVGNISYGEVKNLYKGETMQIFKDLILEGYIISSDQMGNFFGVLHVQDSPVDPNHGLQIEIDVRNTHLLYPVGSKVYIKLKGLYLGKSKGVFKIGGQFTSFGNSSVGRLPAAVVDQHLFVSCDAVKTIEPMQIALADLDKYPVNTLIQIDNMEMKKEEVGLPFAEAEVETERTLIDCMDRELILLNSGYADFQGDLLPELNGSIVGVLFRENEKYLLIIRNREDMDFGKERCAELVDEFTSQKFFISELADPDNDATARFVELYNSDSESLSLKGWSLRRYTNANTEVSSVIDLSGHIIQAGQTLVISPNISAFESVYGFAPDLGAGTNSPADSNGDDNLQLVDPFGVVVDSFGRVGEDGSGTDHEFEDGRAVRDSDVTLGSPRYIFGQWIIYNDNGDSGTINLPQNAPEDFSPGIR